MAYAYLVRCSDGSLYAGSTRNLEHRLWQHNSPQEGALYTRERQPVTLAWSAEFDNIGDAFAFEKRLQKWGRAKREALIAGDWDLLRHLSKRRGGQPRADPPGEV